jgi:hypothetical protein
MSRRSTAATRTVPVRRIGVVVIRDMKPSLLNPAGVAGGSRYYARTDRGASGLVPGVRAVAWNGRGGRAILSAITAANMLTLVAGGRLRSRARFTDRRRAAPRTFDTAMTLGAE